MAFEVRITRATAGDRTGDVYELTDAGETVRAEVWPQWGFNCLRWQVRQTRRSLGRHPLRSTRLGIEPGSDAERPPDPVPVPGSAARRNLQL